MSLNSELLPHLFRQEYAKMTAVLCRHFGLNRIEVAEDIASDTFLKASEHWAVNGVPGNPEAWLYTVAKNKTRDYLRRKPFIETGPASPAEADPSTTEIDFEVNREILADSRLAMIFAVCNPANSDESQICLALQILCGFNPEEIANAFLAKKETIKKRLQRARLNLRNNNFQINSVGENEIISRLDTVLRTLYLLFNEGYFSKTNNRQIRTELCSEAVRLALLLTENPLTNRPRTNALLALMCFQSSRLAARTNDDGDSVLFEEQNKSLWDTSLIQRGNYYLVKATDGNEISKYHLEAGVAWWHTTANERKWPHILELYNRLILMEYSPLTALNRAFALAKVYGNEMAIREVKKLNLPNSTNYQELLGYLYADADPQKAIKHYETAIGLSSSDQERKTLKKAIERLLKKN